MNETFPQSRKKTVDAWPSPFLDSDNTFSFSIIIHDIAFCIHMEDQSLLSSLQDFFPKQWQRPSQNPIEVNWQKPIEDGDPWDQLEDPNCQFSGLFISQRDFLAKRITEKSIELMAPLKIDDGFFNFLRYLLPLELIKKGKVLFHSSCVVDNKGEAYLFFGPSGAGKTTISSLCQAQGGNVLGDDMNLISFDDNHVFVESAAVGQRIFNKNNFSDRYPLKRAFWLQQSPVIRHRELTTGQLSLLLSSFANFFWNQLSDVEYQKLFSLLSKVNSNIDLFELEFTKTQEVWNYVQSID